MGNKIVSGATLRGPHLAGTSTDLYGGTEFIARDVLFKSTNAGAPSSTEFIHTGVPAEG